MSVVDLKTKTKAKTKSAPYSGYYNTDIPPEDPELTHTGPGTPCGEFMRRFWQPVALSEKLTEVPLAIRILGEDLVCFKDKEGNVGVMHRHCCHRGASLEYGMIAKRGIRCCYHGFHFDIDGTILEVPGLEDKGAKLAQILHQPAYPAFERDGLVFAYMGPPEEKPEFPEWESLSDAADSEWKAFSNILPCNWLQAQDNMPDQVHTTQLHYKMTVDDWEDREGPHPNQKTKRSEGKPDRGTTFSDAFGSFPVMQYRQVHGGKGMCFMAGRRVSPERIWVRINHQFAPNGSHHAYLHEHAEVRKLFARSSMTRWSVPVDDENCILYGWRAFGPTIDPKRRGRRHRVGYDDMDFLEGQTGNRTYEEGQRKPGDYEAIISQRRISVHALENPMKFDEGVYLNRKLIRDAVRGTNPDATPKAWNDWVRSAPNGKINTYCSSTVLEIPQKEDETEDHELVAQISRDVLDIIMEGDAYSVGKERNTFIRNKLATLDGKGPVNVDTGF